MIYFNIPWAEDRNIAEAYNNFMEVVPNDTDFACFIDGDAMFANEFFGAMLYEVIEKEFGDYTHQILHHEQHGLLRADEPFDVMQMLTDQFYLQSVV